MKLLEIRRPGVESAAVSGMAYDAMHAAGGLRQLDSFYLWLLRLLAPTKGARLLDVSCGQGVLLRFAARAGLEAHGLDFSSVALRRARESSPGAALVAGDGERLPYRDGSFDYVTSIGSLEHYLSPARAVQEMARVLVPQGRALVLVPNTFGLLWNIYEVWRKGAVFDDGQPIQRYGTRAQWQTFWRRTG